MPATKPRTHSRTNLSDLLLHVYNRLLDQYGPQHWWPGETDFEVIIGAILTQSTSWSNVEKAISNLKKENLLSPRGLLLVEESKLAELIHSSGYFNAKAKKLKAFIEHLHTHYQGNLENMLKKPWNSLREELLSIYGIGPETADSIVLYAANQPSFVVDAYTRRIFYRLNIFKENESYDNIRQLFMDSLENDSQLFNEYHALIVNFGKYQCKKTPVCETCFLIEQCWYGKSKRKKSKRRK